MSPLRQTLVDYLAVRRSLGYQLARTSKLLPQFLCYLEQRGDKHVRTQTALAWATQPRRGQRNWWSYRLSAVRAFARYLHGLDPRHEVPPTDLLPWRPARATPYLYSETELAAMMAATASLRSAHRAATYRTLIGLLAATGMRVGEALALDRADLDLTLGLLTIRQGKFGKTRQLPLHPTTVLALRRYLQRRDRPRAVRPTAALLVSMAGTRLLYTSVQHTFRGVVQRAGLQPRSAGCRPRVHDLRHTYAVHTLLEGYRQGGDVAARLPLLSTYLGHVNPGATYHYLSAAPELMALAGDRLQQHLGGAA